MVTVELQEGIQIPIENNGDVAIASECAPEQKKKDDPGTLKTVMMNRPGVLESTPCELGFRLQ